MTQTTHSDQTVSGEPPQKSGRGHGKLTLGLSFLALVVAVLSMSLSVLALITAQSDDSATPAPQGTAETTSGTTIPSDSSVPTPSDDESTQTAATDAPLPTASANYTVSYQDRRLSLQPNGAECGGDERIVDLDQPAINVTSGGDMEYRSIYGCRGAPTLQFVSDKVATVVSPNATPQDCAQAIQLSPSRQEISPSQDLVICAVTDGQGAANEPARAKIARIVITGVGQDQKVGLNVTAWEIPY